MVQIGSSGKSSLASKRTLRCTVVAKDSQSLGSAQGQHVAPAKKYVRIWIAKVDPDMYNASIVASEFYSSKIFLNIREAKVNDAYERPAI